MWLAVNTGGQSMAFQVDRSAFDPDSGFEYYICFKPPSQVEGDEVTARISIEVAVSVSETGDIADLSFVLPKACRTDYALTYIKKRPHGNLRGKPRVCLATRPQRRRSSQCAGNRRARQRWTHRRYRDQRLYSAHHNFSSCAGVTSGKLRRSPPRSHLS